MHWPDALESLSRKRSLGGWKNPLYMTSAIKGVVEGGGHGTKKRQCEGCFMDFKVYREPGKSMQNIAKHDPGRARQKS